MRNLLLSLLLLPFAAFGQAAKTEYLRQALNRIEQIESASYYSKIENYAPGDTIPLHSRNYIAEYDNPADTTIGASFVRFDDKDTTRLEDGYDGQAHVSVFHENKGLIIDDFTSRPLPFRPIRSPFFHYAGDILHYALTTGDRIETQLAESDGSYHFRLVIDEDRQVEFFGKAFYIPTDNIFGPVSIYEIWISKSDGLPWRIRREMSHDTTVETISEVRVGQTSGKELQLADYFPEGYEIRNRADQAKRPKQEFALLGKQAPDWTLSDADANPVSLDNFKSKVLLINFTGIGCGACYTSIPFLNKLKAQFPSADFDLVAIESWGKSAHSLQAYTNIHKLQYKLLGGTDDVVGVYLPDTAVPVFILLDEHRTIRYAYSGYGKGSTDNAITDAIGKLLQTPKPNL